MDKLEAWEWLVRRKAQLDEEERLGATDRETVALDQASVGRLSRIDAMQIQAMALATQRRRTDEKLRIDAALLRLKGDEWGTCLGCGEEIALARLKHDPSVTQCINCASENAS